MASGRIHTEIPNKKQNEFFALGDAPSSTATCQSAPRAFLMSPTGQANLLSFIYDLLVGLFLMCLTCFIMNLLLTRQGTSRISTASSFLPVSFYCEGTKICLCMI